MDYILQQAMRSLPGDMICHSKLLLLEESDLTKDTEYLDTLQLYLENQCNASQTASSLNIHRSTMLYRLGKIQEILQSDLRDPEEILHLMLSFRLVDFTGRREQYKRK
jgi:DNA-binding PucR family transcriptional regulator